MRSVAGCGVGLAVEAGIASNVDRADLEAVLAFHGLSFPAVVTTDLAAICR